MAGVSLEKGAALYICTGLWRIHGGLALARHVVAGNASVQGGEYQVWQGAGV